MSSHPFPLAQRMVIDLLGPLVGARGKIGFHHLGPLEAFMYHLWIHRANVEERLRGVRAALLLLERSFDERPGIIAPIAYATFDKLGRVQMEIFGLVPEAWNGSAQQPDARFRPLLNLYAALYERLYPLLAAPLIAADAVLRTGEDPQTLIRNDGRVHPTTVERMETARDYPPGLLTGGLDRHLRNSIGHGRYDVLSRDRIRMEDRDPRTGEMTWGPHEFSYRELRERVFELYLTCETLLATLVMFDVNNHEVIRARGYASPAQLRPRLDVIEATMWAWASGYGFRLEEVREQDNQTLFMKLRITGERQEHPAEILVGGSRGARRYLQDSRTEDVPTSRQVYGLLQVTLDMHDTYDVVVVETLKQDGSAAGRLVVDRAARQEIFEGLRSFDEVRRLSAEDTLIDETMPVIFTDSPRPA